MHRTVSGTSQWAVTLSNLLLETIFGKRLEYRVLDGGKRVHITLIGVDTRHIHHTLRSILILT